MTNFYALFFGVVTSASLMAAYGDPSQGSLNQGTNPSNTMRNDSMNSSSTMRNDSMNPSNTMRNNSMNPSSTMRNDSMNPSDPNSANPSNPYRTDSTNPNGPTPSTSYRDDTMTPGGSQSNPSNSSLRNSASRPDYQVNAQGEAQSAYSSQSTYANKSVAANNDAQITTQIQDRIKGVYKQYNININVSGGVATLSGVVNSQLDRDAIEKDIKNVPGVTRVINKLTIQK